MKKRFLTCSIVLMLSLLCACGSGFNVEQMKDWSFQYNAGTNDYSLFFGLRDKSDRGVSADCTVDIKIVNEDGTTVYRGKREISSEDFGYYSDAMSNEMFLANVRIKANEVSEGVSASGTVYFTVEGEMFGFEGVSCVALNCLPIKEIALIVDETPLDLVCKGGFGTIQGAYTVTDISYSVDYSLSTVKILVSGEKTAESSDFPISIDMIGYKLYDSEEYLVDSGWISLENGLSAGDKFRAEHTIYHLIPGETYTLSLSDYDMTVFP